MLLSKLCSLRTKEIPADAKMKSHQLMIRAGYMKQVANGIYTLTTLGQRACLKIENIIRKEMNSIDGQEVKFPVVMPREMWDLSGRYTSIGNEMVRFEDRIGHKMLLGMTHEEASVHLAKNWISSYTQLPFMIYQIQTKFRDEPRSRGGLIRVREFTMKDAYSFHENMDDLNKYYTKVHDAYMNIYKKIGLKNYISVKSDTGMMGGSVAHEFMSINDLGEDEIIICDCGYKSNQEVAESIFDKIVNETPNGEIEEIFTDEAKTIEEVCSKINCDIKHTIKAVAYAVKGENTIVLAFVRGDREINEAKLKKVTKKDIAPFSAENDDRLCAGTIGPINLDTSNDIIVVYDESLKDTNNMICGANKPKYHLKNICTSRDLPNVEYYDLAKVQEGDTCSVCKINKLKIVHGIEIGNIFQLGTKYTKSMDMRVKSQEGTEFNPIMGCYGIGVGRNLACVIEDNHDDYGIIMPKEIAPFKVHICALRLDDENVNKIAYELYNSLEDFGFETLFDDRNVSAGNKFSDADLIGIPFRIVVSPKSLENNIVEIKDRATGEIYKVSPNDVLTKIVELYHFKDFNFEI